MIMTTQINIKFQDDFYELAKNFADSRGYMSIQELIREALRDKIFDELELHPDLHKHLLSKEATNFIGPEESEKLFDEMRKKAGLIDKKKKV